MNRNNEIIFEVVTSSDIYKRFDSSHPFWEILTQGKKKRRKK